MALLSGCITQPLSCLTSPDAREASLSAPALQAHSGVHWAMENSGAGLETQVPSRLRPRPGRARGGSGTAEGTEPSLKTARALLLRGALGSPDWRTRVVVQRQLPVETRGPGWAVSRRGRGTWFVNVPRSSRTLEWSRPHSSRAEVCT